jgi:hypothetical protein
MLVVLLLTRSAIAQELQPPPPMAPFPQQQQPPQYGAPPQQYQSATTQQLNAAEREDSGRGLEFFYASAGIGASYLGLSASPRSTALGLQKVSGPGFTADVGLGVRFVTITVGPRARLTTLPGLTLWQVDLEAASHIPYGNFDGYFGLHGGYAFSGKISDDSVIASAATSPVSAADMSVHGLDLGLQAGADYYVTSNFSLGFELGGSLYFLSRSAVSSRAPGELYGSSASSVGLGALLGAHAGLHF